MKNSIVLFSFCFMVLAGITGCSSSNKFTDSEIRLYEINTGFFKEYNFLWFPNNYSESDTSGYLVLTMKCDSNKINMDKFEPLLVGETYSLKLFNVDSLVSAEIKSMNNNGVFVRDPNTVYWKNGKIMVKVYFSNDLLGTYVLKGKKLKKK